jgi:hypothetical protein
MVFAKGEIYFRKEKKCFAKEEMVFAMEEKFLKTQEKISPYDININEVVLLQASPCDQLYTSM